MYRVILAGVAACAYSAGLLAQAPQQNTAPPPLNPLLTTGTPIGTPILKPIGTQVQPVGQRQGSNLNTQSPEWRQDPLPPGGKLIDLKNAVAPVPMSSLPPALRTQESPSLLDQIFAKWSAGLGLSKPAQQTNNGYVPGMTRRAKERRERKWIWD
jgi:hypothetical protein